MIKSFIVSALTAANVSAFDAFELISAQPTSFKFDFSSYKPDLQSSHQEIAHGPTPNFAPAAYGEKSPSFAPEAPLRDYGKWAKFTRLEPDSFRKQVLGDEENAWVVAFISPTCRSCTKLSSEFENLALQQSILSRKVKLAFIDITLDSAKEIVPKYTNGKTIQFTPSVMVYGTDKYAPVEYDG